MGAAEHGRGGSRRWRAGVQIWEGTQAGGGPFNAFDISNVPVAVTMFPAEIYPAPRSWGERAYGNLIHWNEVDRGGHFAAWEQPQLLSIAGALHVVKVYELAAVCEYLGLEPQKPHEDPFKSKIIYVRARLQSKTLPELVDIARRVISEYGDDDLQALVHTLGAHGVDGEMKNLIFAADGPNRRSCCRTPSATPSAS
ncbi:hypothetical protein [Streptomyces sp. KR55]|uniref:hypothetical protein n=1 Tax=Streptomyces sp. KR55 TaxID=3457425 RepID=UPI003FCFF393